MGLIRDAERSSGNDGTIGAEHIQACNVLGPTRAVGFIAQNTPWEDIPFTVPTRSLTINGRESILAENSGSSDSCSLLMRTDFGAVIVDTFPLRGGDADPDVRACDGIVETAEAIEPLIDGGT